MEMKPSIGEAPSPNAITAKDWLEAGYERRRGPRFWLDGQITAVAENGNRVAGTIRNAGPKGALFFTQAPVEAGWRLYMVMNLLPSQVFSDKVQLYCIGSVVRLEERKGEETGVAVAVNDFMIVHTGCDRR